MKADISTKYLIKKALEDILKNESQLEQLTFVLQDRVNTLVRLANNKQVIYPKLENKIFWLDLKVLSYRRSTIDITKSTQEGYINNGFIKCLIKEESAGNFNVRHYYKFYNKEGELEEDYNYFEYDEENLLPFLDLEL